jgi:hypothetical protein
MTKPYYSSRRWASLLSGLLLAGALPTAAQQLFAPQIVYPGEGLDIVAADLTADGLMSSRVVTARSA